MPLLVDVAVSSAKPFGQTCGLVRASVVFYVRRDVAARQFATSYRLFSLAVCAAFGRRQGPVTVGR